MLTKIIYLYKINKPFQCSLISLTLNLSRWLFFHIWTRGNQKANAKFLTSAWSLFLVIFDSAYISSEISTYFFWFTSVQIHIYKWDIYAPSGQKEIKTINRSWLSIFNSYWKIERLVRSTLSLYYDKKN